MTFFFVRSIRKQSTVTNTWIRTRNFTFDGANAYDATATRPANRARRRQKKKSGNDGKICQNLNLNLKNGNDGRIFLKKM